jgi:hypothetical protein
MQSVVDMEAKDVAKLLEKHEAEAKIRLQENNRRFCQLEKKIDKLDMRLWGIALLILERNAKKSSRDSSAYKFATDFDAKGKRRKTKVSKHTKAFKRRFG